MTPDPDVTDVWLGLHRQPADVDTDLPLLERHELAQPARRGVVEVQGHRENLPAARPADLQGFRLVEPPQTREILSDRQPRHTPRAQQPFELLADAFLLTADGVELEPRQGADLRG